MEDPDAAKVHPEFSVDAEDVGLGDAARDVAFAAVAVLCERELRAGVMGVDRGLDVRDPRQELGIVLLHPAVLHVGRVPEHARGLAGPPSMSTVARTCSTAMDADREAMWSGWRNCSTG